MSGMSFGRRRLLGLGAGLATGLVAPAALGRTQRPATFNWTLHKPEEVGMTRAGLEAVKAVIQKHIDANTITGAVTVVARRNKLVHYEAQGVRDVETQAPMRKDDIFRMMSSTKPTIGVAVLMMQEEGKLSLDDRVSRFIPEFSNMKVAVLPDGVEMPLRNQPFPPELVNQVTLAPAERDITIRDLMTHTSGLSSGGAGRLVNRMQRGPGDTLADYIPRLGAAALDFQPGSRWSYSASDGIDVLLRIVEIVSKTPAEAFLRERIHEPLDMRDTYFNVPPAKYGRILTLYARQHGGWQPRRATFGYAPTPYISGAGGSMSTAHDYIQFEEMLLNRGELNGKRLLKPESVALMATNATGDMYHGVNGGVMGTGFGLTVRVMRDPVAANSGRLPGAFGWYGAYGTQSWTDPADEMVAALMIQQPAPVVLPDFEHAIRKAVVA